MPTHLRLSKSKNAILPAGLFIKFQLLHIKTTFKLTSKDEHLVCRDCNTNLPQCVNVTAFSVLHVVGLIYFVELVSCSFTAANKQLVFSNTKEPFKVV